MSDLALLAADTSALEATGDPATFVVHACERAKSWLTQAVEHGDIDQIVELKSQAEAIRIYTTQKQLGKDAELAAAEIVRRAERGIGVAIRRGQEEGTIRRQGDNGRSDYQPGDTQLIKRSPSEFVPGHELSGGGNSVGIYDVTDDVTDEQFDEAIEGAKEEGNLSRANVARKVSRTGEAVVSRVKQMRALAADGNTAAQIATVVGISEERVRQLARRLGIPLADTVIGKARRIDSNRIMAEAVSSLEAAALGVDLIVTDDLDPARIEDWATSLSNSLRSLNRLSKQLKEMTQ